MGAVTKMVHGKVRLSYKNNWEADEYYADGKCVESLQEVSIRNKKYKVHSRLVRVPYDDMGHTYIASSKHYYVEEVVFGSKREFDLNSIITKQPVFATQYTTREIE